MPLSLTGKCDCCGIKLQIQHGVLGTSPVSITIEELMFSVKKEAVVCSECWKRLKKALDVETNKINESNQTSTSELPLNELPSEVQTKQIYSHPPLPGV